jgi:hypothetical protein
MLLQALSATMLLVATVLSTTAIAGRRVRRPRFAHQPGAA